MDWPAIRTSLLERGFASTGPLLGEDDCSSLIRAYDDERNFRKRIAMERHGYGRGEYQYFSYPLLPLVDRLRHELFPRLSEVANEWAERSGLDERYPANLDAYLERCHEAGQLRPTPLLLKYGVGDYNRLHQDLYGELLFPLQLTVVLSEQGDDFDGADFVLVEQRPRMQSRAHVLHPKRGEGILFAVNQFPRAGTRGFHCVKLRHGVSELEHGERYALGVIFHDAR
jgi:hypothetical protein